MRKQYVTYSEEVFLAVCRQNKIPETSTECSALRDKFKRVLLGKGTEQESRHVQALLDQASRHAD